MAKALIIDAVRTPMTGLAWALRRREARFGIAALCVGVGQGVATVIENPAVG